MDDKQQIADHLRTDAFAQWWDDTPALVTHDELTAYKKSQGTVTVTTGVFDDALRAAMGGGTIALVLARDTIAHIKAAHPNVRPRHLLLVQRALDGDDVFQDGVNTFVAFAADDEEKIWKAPWKNIAGRSWQLTMYRSNEKQLRRARKVGVALR